MVIAHDKIKQIIYLFLIFLFIICTLFPVEATVDFLTEEEREYISENKVLRAASIKGVAPLAYADSKGNPQGIAKRVVDEIAKMTGLVFEITIYDSYEELLDNDVDIIYGISPNYVSENILLSKPFLESASILYMKSSLDPENLDDKIFAEVEGGTLPDGIQEDKVTYYKTREDAIDAVEKGKADYGYGNAYSLFYYFMRNDYKNIVTIPQELETVGYCIGILNGDEILLDIINKSIDAIDETLMQIIILEVSTHVGQKITFDRMIDKYGDSIKLLTILIIGILLYNVISNNANNKLSIQIKRYEALSQISNEYFYEYNVKLKQLNLSEKFNEIFGQGKELSEVKTKLINHLLTIKSEEDSYIIEVPLITGGKGVFKAISTRVLNERGEADFIIGKLIDISEDVAEKEYLLNKSQIDGLTGLYNAITTKENIKEKISNKKRDTIDAFILLDCDNFKKINDTHGHLMGDKILEQLAKTFKQTFRSVDIIGRIGGDEFCVYMSDVSSIDDVKAKCELINLQLSGSESNIISSVSIGIASVENNDTYEDVFKKADIALYEAKNKGKAQCVVTVDVE